jgi:CRP-like cAMP-binding protein
MATIECRQGVVGDHVIGEVALMMEQPRNATIRANDRVEVYAVDRATFDRYKSVSRPFIGRILENFRSAATCQVEANG